MGGRSWRRYRPRAATPWSSLRCLPMILDIDHTGTELLVSHTSGTGDGDLAVMPVLGGIERRVGDVRINHRWHVRHRRDLDARQVTHRLREGHRRCGSPGAMEASRGRCSRRPASRSLRACLPMASGCATRSATRRPEPSHSGRPGPTAPTLILCSRAGPAHRIPCCGIWTADGRYYVFEAEGNLWARAEAGGLFRRPLERSGATHVRAAAVLGSDAKPRRQAPVRGRRSAQGPAGTV